MKIALPQWTHVILLLAGIYNLLWGAWVVLFPSTAFSWLDVDPPKYLELWQCIGMIVGCYGIAYLIASTDPARYWPITLVGLIGKVAGPIGFVQALWTGVFPLSFGWLIVLNDLVWWIPFTGILLLIYRAHFAPVHAISAADREILLTRYTTSKGRWLKQATGRPEMWVFLRHSGCTFCREMISDLSQAYPEIQKSGVEVMVVHMSNPQQMDQLLADAGLEGVEHVSDPECGLYRGLGLAKGSWRQLFGPEVWRRGWEAGIRQRHGVGWLAGDGFQMPGVFGFLNGKQVTTFIHQHAGERPDYLEICKELRAHPAAMAKK